jgi:hypothetical protein
MIFYVPVGMRIQGFILLIAANFNLREAPLRQHCIGSTEVAPQQMMAEPQTRRQRMYPIHLLSPLHIIHDLHLPIIPHIPHRRVPITRHFVVELRYRRNDRVRVQITGGRGVREPDDVPVRKVLELIVRIVLWLVPPRQHSPVVVVVSVVVAGDLLLCGTDRVGLYVRVQEAPAPSHVFESDLRAVCNFW